jgi:dihydroflavonol-4-reductase
MRHVINVIDVRDVASLIAAAVAARHYGARIPLTGHNVAVDELARRIALMAGVGAPLLSTNASSTAIAAFWMESAFAMTGSETPDAWRAAPLIADAWPMEESVEQRALGVRVRPLDDTLRDAVQWHREQLGR